MLVEYGSNYSNQEIYNALLILNKDFKRDAAIPEIRSTLGLCLYISSSFRYRYRGPYGMEEILLWTIKNNKVIRMISLKDGESVQSEYYFEPGNYELRLEYINNLIEKYKPI
jgi:hypothetical protein